MNNTKSGSRARKRLFTIHFSSFILHLGGISRRSLLCLSMLAASELSFVVLRDEISKRAIIRQNEE
jgi:hypothetical protein